MPKPKRLTAEKHRRDSVLADMALRMGSFAALQWAEKEVCPPCAIRLRARRRKLEGSK